MGKEIEEGFQSMNDSIELVYNQQCAKLPPLHLGSVCSTPLKEVEASHEWSQATSTALHKSHARRQRICCKQILVGNPQHHHASVAQGIIHILSRANSIPTSGEEPVPFPVGGTPFAKVDRPITTIGGRLVNPGPPSMFLW